MSCMMWWHSRAYLMLKEKKPSRDKSERNQKGMQFFNECDDVWLKEKLHRLHSKCAVAAALYTALKINIQYQDCVWVRVYVQVFQLRLMTQLELASRTMAIVINFVEQKVIRATSCACKRLFIYILLLFFYSFSSFYCLIYYLGV